MLSNKYQSALESSSAFMAKIEDLVREIAIQNSVPYYRIESQMEHHPHLGTEESYIPVIRIITYFEDTVNKFEDILNNEFEIAKGKSVDKKKNRLDSFSYKHIQYVASLKANRRDLTEYKRCGDKKFEIQLCSMLQDAWSGIEKELGYDNAAFPDESKRDFYRVGALLEMADIEFLKIRREAAARNEADANQVTANHIEEEDEIVPVDNMELIERPSTFEDYLQAVAHDAPAINRQQPQVYFNNSPVSQQPVITYSAPVIHGMQSAQQPAARQQAPVQPQVAPVAEVVAAPQAPAQPQAAPVAEVVAAPQAPAQPQAAAPVQPQVATVAEVVAAPQAPAQPQAAAPVQPEVATVAEVVAVAPAPAAPQVAPVAPQVAPVAEIVAPPQAIEEPQAVAPVAEVVAAPQPVVNNIPTPFSPPQTTPIAEPVAEEPIATNTPTPFTPPVAPQIIPFAPPAYEPAAAAVNTVAAPAAPAPQETVTQVAASIAAVAAPAAAAFSSIVPKRVKVPTPVTVAAGLAPKRVSAPTVTRVETADMNVNSKGSLAVNPVPDNKNFIIDEQIADIINIGSLVEQPIPAPMEEAKHAVHSRAASMVGSSSVRMPESIAPVINNIATAVPGMMSPRLDNMQNRSALGGGRTPDSIRDEVAAQASDRSNIFFQERATPFFEDQPAVARVTIDENAPMTDASLREYVINSKLLKEIDLRIAERAGAKINSEIDIEGDVERLRFLKVFTLKQLHDRLTDNKNDIVAFAEKWIGKDNGGSFDSGISLFYLEYLLVGKKNDPAFAIEYVVKFISDNDYSARYIIPTYNSIRNSDVPNNFSHLTLKA